MEHRPSLAHQPFKTHQFNTSGQPFQQASRPGIRFSGKTQSDEVSFSHKESTSPNNPKKKSWANKIGDFFNGILDFIKTIFHWLFYICGGFLFGMKPPGEKTDQKVESKTDYEKKTDFRKAVKDLTQKHPHHIPEEYMTVDKLKTLLSQQGEDFQTLCDALKSKGILGDSASNDEALDFIAGGAHEIIRDLNVFLGFSMRIGGTKPTFPQSKDELYTAYLNFLEDPAAELKRQGSPFELSVLIDQTDDKISAYLDSGRTIPSRLGETTIWLQVGQQFTNQTPLAQEMVDAVVPLHLRESRGENNDGIDIYTQLTVEKTMRNLCERLVQQGGSFDADIFDDHIKPDLLQAYTSTDLFAKSYALARGVIRQAIKTYETEQSKGELTPTQIQLLYRMSVFNPNVFYNKLGTLFNEDDDYQTTKAQMGVFQENGVPLHDGQSEPSPSELQTIKNIIHLSTAGNLTALVKETAAALYYDQESDKSKVHFLEQEHKAFYRRQESERHALRDLLKVIATTKDLEAAFISADSPLHIDKLSQMAAKKTRTHVEGIYTDLKDHTLWSELTEIDYYADQIRKLASQKSDAWEDVKDALRKNHWGQQQLADVAGTEGDTSEAALTVIDDEFYVQVLAQKMVDIVNAKHVAFGQFEVDDNFRNEIYREYWNEIDLFRDQHLQDVFFYFVDKKYTNPFDGREDSELINMMRFLYDSGLNQLFTAHKENRGKTQAKSKFVDKLLWEALYRENIKADMGSTASAEKHHSNSNYTNPEEKQDFEAALKSAYRKAQRLCHPDLGTAADKDDRETASKQVNEYYEKENLPGIEQIITEWEKKAEEAKRQAEAAAAEDQKAEN